MVNLVGAQHSSAMALGVFALIGVIGLASCGGVVDPGTAPVPSTAPAAASDAPPVSPGAPQLAVEIDSMSLASGGQVDFGNIACCTEPSKVVVVKNTGNADLKVSGFAISGTDAGKFTLSDPAYTGTIKMGESKSMLLFFKPGAVGSFSATLAVSSDDAAAASYALTLNGTGSSYLEVTATLSDSSPLQGATVYVDDVMQGITNADGKSIVLAASGTRKVRVLDNGTSKILGNKATVNLSGDSGAVSLVCDRYYNYGTTHFYKLVGGAQTWTNARDQAVGFGGHLVSIADANENAFVKSLLPESTEAWIGATDEAIEGTWKWSTNESVVFTSWAANEPSISGDEDYVTIKSDGTWSDRALAGPYAYVCEWD